MSEQVVNRRLNIYIDSASAEASLEKLTKQEQKLVESIEKGTKAGKDMTKEMEALASTRTRLADVKNVIDGKMLPSLKMAEDAVRKVRNELKNIPADSEAAGRKLQELRAAESTLESVRQKVRGVSTELNGIKENKGVSVFKDVFAGSFLGGGLAGIAQAGMSAVKDFFSSAIDEALQAEEATARFRATLDNLGRSDAFDRLIASADKLADAFGYLDNDDIIGVFEKLIDYGKLTEKQINQLTPVIIDFAAKQRIDLNEAASVVIKALEGNGKALKQYGIDIGDAKNTAEAFGIVMTQLAPKVEGAAKTFGDTTAGQIKKTRQEINNLKEDIASVLLPIWQNALKIFSGLINGIADIGSAMYNAFAGTPEQSRAMVRAQEQRMKAITDYRDSLVKDFEAKDKTTQQKLLTAQRLTLNGLLEEYKTASAERKKVLKNQINEEAAILKGFKQVSSGPGTEKTLGIGDANKSFKSSEPKKDKKPNDDTKKELEDLKDRYKEFAVKTEEATAPILAAFRKINEQAEKDIALVKKSLLKGIISPQEAEKALGDIQKVLDEQRTTLQKKFNLTPTQPADPVEVPIELRIEKDLNETGFKEFGKKVGLEISKGAEEFLKQDDRSGFEKWFDGIGEQIVQWAGQVSSIYTSIAEIRANADNAALEKEQANNQKRIDSVRKLYESNLISEKEYNTRVDKINKEQEKKEKEIRKRQFERDKNMQTAQALMSAAQAIISTLAARPGTTDIISLGAFRAIQIGIIAATTAAQVAAIRSAKPPQFESGGFIPQGSSHRQGGIGLIDNRTGAIVGEVEGGEPIISKRVYAANKPLIDSLIARGQGMSLNIPKLNSSMQRVFENGGFIPSSGDGMINSDLLLAIKTLNQNLSQPLYANVVYSQFEAASSRLTSIRSQSIVS